MGETYVEELTFDINANRVEDLNLPSTLDPAGITYTIDEINAARPTPVRSAPDALTLSGNLGETINVVITNGYASVQIDKTASTSTVVAGAQITYTLQATNTGGLTLNPVVISDRLPPMVALASATVAGGAGECHLAESTRPQLLSCTMNDALGTWCGQQLDHTGRQRRCDSRRRQHHRQPGHGARCLRRRRCDHRFGYGRPDRSAACR